MDPQDAGSPPPRVPLKDTLNLPRTEFSMRGNLGQKEPGILAQWQQSDLLGQLERLRAGAPRFVMHDGPPYANGALHQGHVLNKVLKDVVVKDRSMRGEAVSYIPGWDCHGLPIEVQVDKELKGKARSMPPVQVHEACNAYAARFVKSQAEGFARLGVLADWQRPYRTMDAAYEAAIVREFGRLVQTGCIYRGLRPVHWCTVHQTALAEAEIEYATKRSPSIYVAFRLDAAQAGNDALTGAVDGPIDVVIWTTTPWTLPANVAVAVHPEATYVLAPYAGRHVLVAEALWPAFVAATPGKDPAADPNDPRAAVRLRGAQLQGLTYRHPFMDRTGVVVADDFVTLDSGTGAVHSAPAHGAEDFALGLRHKLDVTCPVDGAGMLTDGAGPFAGLHINEAAEAIVVHLDQQGALLSPPEASIEHRYAHCWRCHKPIITRATQQWFLALDKAVDGRATLRQAALGALETVTWIPAAGIERIRGMLKARPDWCLSRQRTWGVPVPVAFCARCEQPLLDADAIFRAADYVAEHGARGWYDAAPEALFGQARCAHCGHDKLRKERDILDVWFDSGVSFAAVLEARKAAHPTGPAADLYLEGSDQHRGWFHSSLLLSVATRGHAPYRQVLTHGFVVDGQGKKLSKSLGNAEDPFVTIARDGAELFRLWVASEDFQQDVRISPLIMRQIGEHYRKLRNTVRYLLGNLHGFVPERDLVAPAALLPLDRYMLLRHGQVMAEVNRAMADYQFHAATQQLLQYCNVDLSAFYLDVLKDRLYADATNGAGRRAGQSVLYVIARDLLRALAPVLAFTAEEAWQHLPRCGADQSSVHLMRYAGEDDPEGVVRLREARDGDAACLARFGRLLALRGVCNAALEEARRARQIGSSTEARLHLALSPEDARAVDALGTAQLCDLLIVSQIDVGARDAEHSHVTAVARAEGEKCPRCWLYRPLGAPSPTAPGVCVRCHESLAC